MPEIGDLKLHWIDSLIILGYLALLLAIGFYHSRRQHDLKDYFLANREIRWLAVGLSLMAAINSGLDYLMQPAAMIKFGVYTMVGSLTWIVLVPYACYVTMPMYRRLGAISAYDYLEKRFDVRVRVLAAGIFLFWRMGWIATAMYVPSLAISVATGERVSVATMVVTIGLVVTFYTTLGGIRAVIWNDVIQFWIMFTGLTVTICLCVMNVDGGVATILAQYSHVGEQAQIRPPSGAPAGLLSYFYTPMTLSGFFISVLVSRLANYTSDQVMVQRFQTAVSVADARRGLVVLAVTDALWMTALSFVGLALFAYFNAKAGGLPDWATDRPDQLFPYFISQIFPTGLTGLVIAAILAASISSIDSGLNSISSVVTVDFIERFSCSDRNLDAQPMNSIQRRRVFTSRLVTVVVGLISITLSLNVSRLGSLLEINNKMISSFTGPLLGIYLLGMFTFSANSMGVLVGGVGGALITIFIAFQAQIYRGFNHFLGTDFDTEVVFGFLWPATFGLVSTLLIGYATSTILRTDLVSNRRQLVWREVVNSPSRE